MRQAIFIIIWLSLLTTGMIFPATRSFPAKFNPTKSTDETDTCGVLPDYTIRPIAVHDAGRFYLPIDGGGFPSYRVSMGSAIDPETCRPVLMPRYPTDSNHVALWHSSLWIGGIVNEDTLVSVGTDGWFNISELWPPKPDSGGVIRTGRFADDEFVSVYTDTIIDWPYISETYPCDPGGHTPMGLKITQSSYSWRDTVYDNFVIVDFVVENIRGNLIRDGWIGVLFDPEIYADTGDGSWVGYRDDASGFLDTLLDPGDPDSRALIVYGFDRDGDPTWTMQWDGNSSREVVSLALLGIGLDNPTINFNWWLSNGNRAYDFGPRQIGTPDDPFRPFFNSGTGTPCSQEDKYYILSHRERDYNHLEMMVHDSTDGWLAPAGSFDNYIHDAKCLLSFGPFDLAPGDSMTFAVAVVGSDDFHVSPDDYRDYFSPASSDEYEARLDFTDLMVNHRRADSVYRSGYILPHPGPPIGLHLVDYDDDSVALAWKPSSHPAVTGYFLNVLDSVYDNHWHHAFPAATLDSFCTFPVINSTHEYDFAISLIDSTGVESAPSRVVSIIPARPHTPDSLVVSLDSLTPMLTWIPPDDAGLPAYIIYRAIWQGPFEVYDSTMQFVYCDEQTESGVKYSYRITARNESGVESEPTDSVAILPMALDQGILFGDLNIEDDAYVGPYKKSYIDRLFHYLQPVTMVSFYDIQNGKLNFKTMADYSVIIFDAEKRGGRLPGSWLDSISNYLSYGGRALFIVPNAAYSPVGSQPPFTTVFEPESFYNKILHLDSAVTNSIVIQNNAIWGDLAGCLPAASDFPILITDTVKLAAAIMDINGFIPMAGCLYPDDSVDIIYRYQSLYPDSIFHDQVNGIGYAEENCRFVLFNFQLSLMEEPSNIVAMKRALDYLGVDMYCGDINDDLFANIGDAVFIIDYLYRAGPPPADDRRADVNCDTEVNLGDAVEIINLVFRDGPPLSCCRQ